MRFHLVEAGAGKMQNVAPPTVNLPRSGAPEHLVEHDI